MADKSMPRKWFLNNRGFTLLEIMVVITIISIMTLLVLPRISRLFDTKRNNFFILTTVIAKTFDDSFLKDRT
ncbi:MAG: prepilin-type N-terminal cleavage/methylation domain-containing protein, partial [Spirochaetes bacterium]|nr:prepilin-type N-terminal cleavage/methylation domain-containing protein [Spirochaetota bacterium]